jgi:hypothetical protein
MVLAWPPDDGPDGIPAGGRFSIYFKNMIEGDTPSTWMCPPWQVIVGFNTWLTLDYGKPLCQVVSVFPSASTGQTLRYSGTDWVSNSLLYNNWTNIGIGTVNPVARLDVAGSFFTRGAQVHYDLNFANSATSQWVKIWTLTIPQWWVATTFRFFAWSSYNADSSQNGEAQINFRTSDGNSVDVNGFCWSAKVERTGNARVFSDVKFVGNASGCAATQFDVYVNISPYVWFGYYTVDAPYNVSWTHIMAIGESDPGVWSSTVMIPDFEKVFNDDLSVFGRGFFSGSLWIGTSNPAYKLDVNGTFRTSNNAIIGWLLQISWWNPGEWKILTSDASGVGSWALESDPKIGVNATNFLSKWNGSSLISSSVFESGWFIGINNVSPEYSLDVSGTGNFIGFRFPTGANEGYILTSDANGNARWVATGSIMNWMGETDPVWITEKSSYPTIVGSWAVWTWWINISGTAATASNSLQLGWILASNYALLSSPAFVWDPVAPTPTITDNDKSIATTEFVKIQGYLTSVPLSITGTTNMTPIFKVDLLPNGTAPVRTSSTTFKNIQYVYWPFTWNQPACPVGTDMKFRVYAELVDDISTGWQNVAFRLALDDGTNLDFDMASTWWSSPQYHAYLSSPFSIMNANHAWSQVKINGAAWPYVEIRNAEIWTYCVQ